MKRHEIKRQRREAEKTNKKYLMTLREIQSIKDEAVTDAINLAFPLALGLTGMVMRDKWGFGGLRMKRLMDQLLDSYESFELGYVSLDDCVTAIKEETGYDIVEMIEKIDKNAEVIFRKSKTLKRVSYYV